jgi:predicted negative regulator of RcsB-dependent stress response
MSGHSLLFWVIVAVLAYFGYKYFLKGKMA